MNPRQGTVEGTAICRRAITRYHRTFLKGLLLRKIWKTAFRRPTLDLMHSRTGLNLVQSELLNLMQWTDKKCANFSVSVDIASEHR